MTNLTSLMTGGSPLGVELNTHPSSYLLLGALGAGSGVLGTGSGVLGAGSGVLGAGSGVLGAGSGVLGAGSGVLGAGILGVGSGVLGTGSGKLGTGSGVFRLGSGVLGAGSGIFWARSGDLWVGSGALGTNSSVPRALSDVMGAGSDVTGVSSAWLLSELCSPSDTLLIPITGDSFDSSPSLLWLPVNPLLTIRSAVDGGCGLVKRSSSTLETTFVLLFSLIVSFSVFKVLSVSLISSFLSSPFCVTTPTPLLHNTVEFVNLSSS